MAAYAALLSLKFILNQIQQHPRPPISLDQQQLCSLTENLTFLQNFFQGYSKEEDELESRIMDAAYAAEDIIESHIVDQVHAGSTSTHGENISSIDLYQSLERVIQDLDSIKKEVMDIVQEIKNNGAQHHDQLMSTNSSISIGPARPVSRMHNTMVDFGDILVAVMDKLTRKDSDLEIVPIVGMGGMGKTTLARNIYEHPLIVQHFDILAWVTISQDFSVPQILLQALSEESKGDQVHELGERVHKKLWGRRYLIVMDDMWSIEVWDKVKSFFPNNNDGSKIMITTRLSNLAFLLSGSHVFEMKFLDEHKSWNLLREIVFGKEGCPIELEDIGKEVARKCRGLPLSIVVIGGLVTNSNKTREYWEYILENLNSQINLENNEYCLQILRTSYRELPIHLKPCFLYMGVFQEDYEIYVPNLMKLWVAEGFLKPIENKSLEEGAKEYFRELIDRNLILVHELRWNGKAKSCKIHDLLRDLCLVEAKKQRFICVLRLQDLNIPKDINIVRRICIHDNKGENFPPKFIRAVESASLTRSLILSNDGYCRPPPSSSCRLLRVHSCVDLKSSCCTGYGDAEALFQQANLRYLSLEIFRRARSFPTSWYLLWNLQTLVVTIRLGKQRTVHAPSDIWKMPHLRHVMFNYIELSYPPFDEDDFVLENLQTLSVVRNFKCSEEVIKRIPNIRTLRLSYDRGIIEIEGLHSFRLNNLGRLQNLKSLNLNLSNDGSPFYSNPETMQNLSLPHALKKLSLRHTRFLWEDVNTKIGLLPLLEVLELKRDSCVGPVWETMEGQFCSLKFLLIEDCDLKCWMTEDTHFQRLEHLVLEYLFNMDVIPLSIGDIPTLQSIHLKYCLKSANASAERIQEEQLSYGNEDLQLKFEYFYFSKEEEDDDDDYVAEEDTNIQ